MSGSKGASAHLCIDIAALYCIVIVLICNKMKKQNLFMKSVI